MTVTSILPLRLRLKASVISLRSHLYNSRGVHYVDPTGTPERELTALYRSRAEEIENAGFQRFAVTLHGLADGYDREAERIIDEHKRDDE